MSADADADARAPPPALGSARYFMLLYCPRERRDALTTLLALAHEISAGIERQLDHGLAHLRLQWWQQEAQRFANGAPEHPWLIRWRRQGSPALDLAPLIEAASVDLATAQLAGSAEHRLTQALFVLAARLLTTAPLAAPEQQRLDELGGYVGDWEAGTVGTQPTATAAPRSRVGADVSAAPEPPIQPASQPQLAPLLVWLALAAHQAHRRQRRARATSPRLSGSRFDGFVDNIIAWRAARRAARGQFRLKEFSHR